MRKYWGSTLGNAYLWEKKEIKAGEGDKEQVFDVGG